MDLHYPVPSINVAVEMRDLSDYKKQRTEIEKLFGHPQNKIDEDRETFITQLRDALYLGMVNCYAQGMGLLHKASLEMNMEIPLADVVKIWRGGCIIRYSFLEILRPIYQEDGYLENLLMSEKIAELLKPREDNTRKVLSAAIQNGFPVAGLAATLSYFDSFKRKNLPVNLIQAQRDYFGSHTYERIDEEGTFHTEWESKENTSKRKEPTENDNSQ
jgi:6-phosphogluconate dehydrogenase